MHTTAHWAQLDLPAPGSPEEEQRFQELYSRLPGVWRSMTAGEPQTLVVVPSLTLDETELRKIKGAVHYEERLLFTLILLSHPKSRVVFVTSWPLDPGIVDYYLKLILGMPYTHARSRLSLFSARDTSEKSLTQKILERPTLMRRIRKAVGSGRNAHLTVFNVTPLEKRLSVALGLPLLGPHPRHLPHGSKSGSRKLFRQAGVPLPEGFEDLTGEDDIIEAIRQLRVRCPQVGKVVIKLNDGFSGEGNALLALPQGPLSRARLADVLRQELRFQAAGMTWEGFLAKFVEMRGIVEEFIDVAPSTGGRGGATAGDKCSPSVQLRVTPTGAWEIISTHDQILGGPDGQIFLGCRFPAQPPYQDALHRAGEKVGRALAEAGVVGRAAIDFVGVPRPDGSWDMKALEINLRKGGTTHPFRTLQFLTGGHYDVASGLYHFARGTPRYYFASDNLQSPRYAGLNPDDLVDLATYKGLHYSSASASGTIFHMLGATSQFGKLGVTCIADSHEAAEELYRSTVVTLDQAVDETDWIN